MMKEEKSRVHTTINGLVQGVFFRAETKKAADHIGISGWVRNCSNGDVEAVFEGPQPLIEKMIEWCHQGSPRSKVEQVDVRMEAYKGEFKGFDIRY